MRDSAAKKHNQVRNAPLNLNTDTFRKNAHALVDEIAAFLELLPGEPVTGGKQPGDIRKLLGENGLSQEGLPLEHILYKARELLFTHSLHNGSPRFWGYITSSAAPSGMLADFLASAVNANVGANILSPVATEIEKQTIQWLAEFIGYGERAGGLFVSGGNMANITGLLAARRAKADWDIRQQGFAQREMLIYCTEGTHTWVHKAADLLGFGLKNIRWIEMNEQQQMNVTALEEQIKKDRLSGYIPFVAIGTAGSVSAGVVDPLEEIAAVCKEQNLWFHVDGAYGAPAAAVPEAAHLFNGMEKADSVAMDPHKWLYSPIEAGCVLVKNPKHLQDAFSFNPPYYNFNNGQEPLTNFHEYGMQNTRGFKALKVWVQLQQAGRSGYIKMISDDIRLAKKLGALVEENDELEIASQHLSIVCFRYIPGELRGCLGTDEYLNRLNEKILNDLQAGAEVFVSNAVISGSYYLRACIVNFRTTEADIETLIERVLKTGRLLSEQWNFPEKVFIINPANSRM